MRSASRPASEAAAVTTDNSGAWSSIALPAQDGGGGAAQEGCNNAARGAGRLQRHGAARGVGLGRWRREVRERSGRRLQRLIVGGSASKGEASFFEPSDAASTSDTDSKVCDLQEQRYRIYM